MKALETIFTRRSIRTFLKRPIPSDILETVLKAGMYAPSAGNQQPWQFIVVDERRLLERIMAAHPYAGMLKTAPAAVLVCGDVSLEKFSGNWVIDCSAATQNILLAAHALGLGAVWVGVYPEDDRISAMRKIFGLSENVRPHSLVPIGYTDYKGYDADRFKPERIHKNGW